MTLVPTQSRMPVLLASVQADLTPCATDAVCRFLQPRAGDQDEALRHTLAVKLLDHFPPSFPFYCCPETRLLCMLVCLIALRDPRDDAQLHTYVMLGLLHRRLPSGCKILREWPTSPIRYAPSRSYAVPATLRRLAREMTRVWVVRRQTLDDVSLVPRVQACVLERA